MMSQPTISPDFASFSAQHASGKAQLVWCKLVADMETPVSAMLKLANGDEPSFLLESVQGGETRGRYSIIGIRPDKVWKFTGHQAEYAHFDTKGVCGAFSACEESTIPSLRKLIADSQIEIPQVLPPMAAGLIGYMNYDAVRLAENVPDENPDSINTPDGVFMRPSITAIFDNIAGVIYLIAPVWEEMQGDAKVLYEAACQRLHYALARLAEPVDASQHYHDVPAKKFEFTANMKKEQFGEMVNKAKEYITAGDIFQVVLSQRFSAPFDLPPFAMYRALRHLNPSPFLFYMHFGAFTLVGSSPEILVRLRDGKVTIRPIAGTRKRGATPAEDMALEQELLADPKEISEHLMLLDLGRNDVGRVSKIGTVKVTEQMIVERYSHVMHIVSNVEGKIAPKYDAIDALFAGFPAGTTSGAPKIRAMEIIDELEPTRRSFYAGCGGYFSSAGVMDTCIFLRTAIIKDGVLHVQAGAGIVADSVAESEYQECRNKAMALIKAAEMAASFVPPASSNHRWTATANIKLS